MEEVVPMIHITPLLLSGNHASGRSGHRPEAVVIHIMEGTMESTLSWFRSPESRVSAHYGVSRAGEVVQYVRDEDTAWHAGRVLRPTAEMVVERPGVNPNLWTIGIEHEGGADQEPTTVQLAASAELMKKISDRWAIPLDLRHVIPHRAIYAAKTCPGRIDVRTLVGLATRGSGPGTGAGSGAPEPGTRRWSNHLREYVILTRYVSDDEWYFVPESELRRMGDRAGAAWSEMPLSR
jgi:N-acetyl-anhydromuramyl-L-alanine amidase AmpD